jgi:antitoxin component of MazEF toxin-antitoxin module
MEAIAQIQKLGSGLGVNIPPVFVNEFSLKEGLYVNIQGNENSIIIETVKPCKSYILSDLLSNITENNTHQCIDTGTPIGNEIW